MPPMSFQASISRLKVSCSFLADGIKTSFLLGFHFQALDERFLTVLKWSTYRPTSVGPRRDASTLGLCNNDFARLALVPTIKIVSRDWRQLFGNLSRPETSATIFQVDDVNIRLGGQMYSAIFNPRNRFGATKWTPASAFQHGC
jgi:hypothetical protein